MSITTSVETVPVPDAGPASVPDSQPDLLRRERAALREILRLVSDRAAAEAKVAADRASGDAAADSEYQKARANQERKFEQWRQDTESTDQQRRREIIEAKVRGEAKAKDEFAASSRKIAQDFDMAREATKQEANRGKSEVASGFENAQVRAVQEHAAATKPILDLMRVADGLRDRLAIIAADYAKLGLKAEAPIPSEENYSKFADPVEELFTRLSRMEGPLKLLEGLIIPKLLKGKNEVWIYVIVILLIVGLAVTISTDLPAIGGGVLTGAALAVLARIGLARVAKSQLEERYLPLMQWLADSDNLAACCRGVADDRLKDTRHALVVRREDDLRRVEANRVKAFRAAEAQRDERLRKINEVYTDRLVEARASEQRSVREAAEDHQRRVAELQNQTETKRQRLEEKYRALKEQIQTRYETSHRAMVDAWQNGMKAVGAEWEAISREVAEFCPSWSENDASWSTRPHPQSIPPILRFGAIPLELDRLPGGLPKDPRLMDDLPARFDLPALRAFPAAANLLIESPPEGRQAALEVLQASMFRLLTSLPPGQVRFTIIDPIGIGRNFGAFMHLADFDGALVTNQVWTDARQIEERLADLANHMEMVTQKYLRNEYATLEEYNAVAGEVAEPYRVLVIADFPTRFDEKSAARLAAIAAGGVPCGVLILIAVDSSKPLPPDFAMTDVRPYCQRLSWDGARLVWDDADFGRYPLRLDPPPPAEFATRAIQRVGAAAKDAKRVEVPFEFIAPSRDAWWTQDSRGEIDVPLGKSGATKRQHLELGHGTSQHVLVAGRTGSGKSTLMHALIVNIALNYSPDEIDLYLIDFKKGVEFKVYATHELPHASVVAIESEREFGLSVLQRLDAELRLRADRFRDAGVQDINGYRNAPGTPPLPRILLVVDEFQEFFVEEDKLAQEAALWLDRLVRQGRAFGVHVLLGSQSLSGAQSLGRSTLGQMAIRIALQCSETDAHLILSETNVAPKMLSRPGEAIYNDANGAPEGNSFFQVVWLSDERREWYLDQLHELALQRRPVLARTPIVFEGDAPADLAANPLLRERIEAPTWTPSLRSAQAWVGDAVAIKDPTSALFRRLGGNHLLIVGQNDEAALGVVISVLLSLAAQFPPAGEATERSGARFFALDGTPEDHPQSGVLARVAAVLPHGVEIGGWRETGRILGELAAEVQRRQEAGGDGPELFLLIHDLPRFRDLRRKEDDFSFSRRDDEDASPADRLDLILREGAGLGVHLIAWCDSVNNLNRHFTHQLLREFEMRVLFQMSPNDSGHMLDTPAASKLGSHRALFHSEEQNRLEKFRPYGVPSEEWLRNVGERLARRGSPAAATQ